jgi:hypothetical protein
MVLGLVASGPASRTVAPEPDALPAPEPLAEPDPELLPCPEPGEPVPLPGLDPVPLPPPLPEEPGVELLEQCVVMRPTRNTVLKERKA